MIKSQRNPLNYRSCCVVHCSVHFLPVSLQEGLESGEPGTDDGRFYFHLGDALQRVGDNSVSNTHLACSL